MVKAATWDGRCCALAGDLQKERKSGDRASTAHTRSTRCALLREASRSCGSATSRQAPSLQLCRPRAEEERTSGTAADAALPELPTPTAKARAHAALCELTLAPLAGANATRAETKREQGG
jgi:hypothetical protein